MANPFVHVELSSTDVAASKTFYGKLFDWQLEDVPMGPEGGDGGGEVVGVGTPEDIAANPVSHTGRYLKKRLL